MSMLELGLLSRPRVRHVRQSEIADCGLACIAMVASFHGLDIDLATLRRRVPTSPRGVPLRALMDIADKVGLTPRAVKLPLEELSDLSAPCILHWDLNHYVVMEGVRGKTALIHNPDGHSGPMRFDEISKHFTGIALELQPNVNFQRGDIREKLKLSQLWQNMSGLKRAIAQVLVLTFVLQVYMLATPYYMQIAIDNALPALDLNLLSVLAIGFGLFTLINVGASLLRSFVLLFAGTTLGFSLSSNIARRLFRLPVDWFEKRYTGDILSRFQSVGPVKNLLTEGAVAAIVDGSLALLTLTLMFWYSGVLALLALLAFGSYCIVRAFSFSVEREAKEASIIMRGKEQSTLIETMNGITTLRIFGREGLRHALWQTKLTDSVNAEVRVARIGIWQTTANTFIFGIESIVTIYLAVSFVIVGDSFSIGMVFAYMAYKSQFIQKATALVDNAVALRMLGLHLERLSDIALSDEDRSFGESLNRETELVGKIELRNVFYRYSQIDPFILKDVTLTINRGDFVAITGQSGGGKTTLVKILLGLIEPESGQLLIDGVPIERFGHKSYHRQIAAVLQDDNLFAGTLADNITFFDESIDEQRIINAATAASIHDDISRMPMQYETLVGDMGSTLSGGQKQRVLLARALYKEPRILIMDEGTAHLDIEHERAVNAAISAMGITRIVIAHRKETIEAAERLLIMVGGELRDAQEHLSRGHSSDVASTAD